MMGEMTNEQSLEMKKEKTISWEESRYSIAVRRPYGQGIAIGGNGCGGLSNG